MKAILLAAMLLAAFLLPSCKKKQNTMRTGLESLADPKATNYSIFIIGEYHNGVVVHTDTAIMQNTGNDTIQHTSGEYVNFILDSYDYVSDQYFSTNTRCAYASMVVQFVRTSNYYGVNHDCSLPDTLAYMGYEHLISGAADPTPGVYLWLQNRNGTSAGSDRNDTGTPFEVVSVTDIPSATGCKTVRVKAKFKNVSFYNSICGPVPQFTISQGEFQMDFVNE